jgi:prevent-host-death family protein
MKNVVGTFEAKTSFTKLIQRVSEGEEILITRRGHPVAKIIPLEKNPNAMAAKAAVIRLKALARQMNLGKFDWDEWKHYRDTGRK